MKCFPSPSNIFREKCADPVNADFRQWRHGDDGKRAWGPNGSKNELKQQQAKFEAAFRAVYIRGKYDPILQPFAISFFYKNNDNFLKEFDHMDQNDSIQNDWSR